MTKIVLKYRKYYLVGMNEEKSSSFRVTARDAYGKPGEISFTGRFPYGDGSENYGTLVLDEDSWTKWFGLREKLPGFKTASEAASTLVTNFSSIYYGCPLCSYKAKLREEAQKHIDEHINKYISQFEVEIVEEEPIPKRAYRKVKEAACQDQGLIS